MRFTVVVLVIVGCWGSPRTTPQQRTTSPIPATQIHLTGETWQVGQAFDRQLTTTIVLVKDGNQNQFQQRANLRSTVLAVTDGVVTKLSVQYVDHEAWYMRGPRYKEQGAVLGGRTFLLEDDGKGTILLSNENGTGPRGKVSDAVYSHHQGFGYPNDTTLALARPWKVGDSVSIERGELQHATLTFVDHDGARARFRLGGRTLDDAVTLVLEGELVVDMRDVRFRSIKATWAAFDRSVVHEWSETISAVKP